MAEPQFTAEKLKALVQKMVDEDAPDEVIAKVTKAYQAKLPMTTTALADQHETDNPLWAGVKSFLPVPGGGQALATMGRALPFAVGGAAIGVPVGATTGAAVAATAPVSIPLGLAYLAYKHREGILDFMKDPDAAAKEALKTAPDSVKASIQAAVDLAGKDPNEFARQAAQTIGETGAGLVTGAPKMASIADSLANGGARRAVVRIGQGMQDINPRAGVAPTLFKMGGKALASLGGEAEEVAAPSVAGTVRTAPPVGVGGAAAPAGTFTAQELAALKKLNYSPEMIKKIQAQAIADAAKVGTPAAVAAPAAAAPVPSIRVQPPVPSTASGIPIKVLTPEENAAQEVLDAAYDKAKGFGPGSAAAPKGAPLTSDETAQILGQGARMGDQTVQDMQGAGYPIEGRTVPTSRAIDTIQASTPESRSLSQIIDAGERKMTPAQILSEQTGGEASVRPGDITPSQTIEPGAGGPMITRGTTPPKSPAEEALAQLLQKHGAGLDDLVSHEGETSLTPGDLKPSQTIGSTAPPSPRTPDVGLTGDLEAAGGPEAAPGAADVPEAAAETPAATPDVTDTSMLNKPGGRPKGSKYDVPVDENEPAPAPSKAAELLKNVRPTKTRRMVSPTHAGISINDQLLTNKILLENPDITAEELGSQLEQARATRQAGYRANGRPPTSPE